MFGYLILVTGITDFYNFLTPISFYLQCSVSATPRHYGNPALHPEKAPRKMEKGPS